MKKIILASNSKARLELLEKNGYKVTVRATNIVEESSKTEPNEKVIDLASKKLDSYLDKFGLPSSEVVLAADTMIYFQNELIGKAKDANQAYNMLKSFSGKTHQIYSGFALYIPNVGIKSGFDKVTVKFKLLSDLIIMDYITTEEWKGAAGAYRIQGIGHDLVEQIKGDFSVAVGLPLMTISDLIRLS